MKKIFKFFTVIPDESKVPLLKDMEFPVTDDNLKSSLDNVREFYDRIINLHQHEDNLLNSRLEIFLLAITLLAAGYTQIVNSNQLLTFLFSLFGLMFSTGALIVLRRTAKAIEWYLIYLLRIEEKYYSNQIFRAYWTRRNYSKSDFNNTSNAGEKKTDENCFATSLPISQILSVYVPLGSILFWSILMIRSILKYSSVF